MGLAFVVWKKRRKAGCQSISRPAREGGVVFDGQMMVKYDGQMMVKYDIEVRLWNNALCRPHTFSATSMARPWHFW